MNKRQRPDAAPIERLAYTIEEAGDAIGVGRSKIYEMIRAKELKARKIGARTIITHRDLMDCVQALPSAGA